MLEISFWFNVWKTVELTGEPSKINNGVLDALMELTPLNLMLTVELGSPDDE